MSTSIPRPGEHLPGAAPGVDPDAVHVEVDRLIARVQEEGAVGDPAAAIGRQAELLEQAHDVLVQALSTVDKI
ncbi:hypothetical protein EV641_112175 [Rhodococcus sp. SMB37]|uniref:hypothetical protein n=1 Tax=Rhodococcus sp. SMB37 TaxID=2512213 RepID=UPI001053E2B8|nr:hypothetical protein [Rhodococcus sp. SMB37]TCN50520.1 hypothetical protein EV641_112175 [Rhodococcus sp. SMB37]